MYEAVAWVKFRDDHAVSLSTDWDGLHAINWYEQTRPAIGNEADLKSALVGGQLTALGSKDGQTFAPIPPAEWTLLRLAPLERQYHAPYKFIQIQKDDLNKQFPKPTAALMRPGKSKLACTHWLQSVDAGDPRTKAEFAEAAYQQFVGLSQREFKAAWDAGASEDRRKPGRKPGR